MCIHKNQYDIVPILNFNIPHTDIELYIRYWSFYITGTH